jgi:Ion channel
MVLGVGIVFTLAAFLSKSILSDFEEFVVDFYARNIRGHETTSLKDKILCKLWLGAISIGLLFLIGTLFFSGNEEWSTLEGAYWTAQTMTSVGYGDLEIKYQSTRLFGIFFILCCCLIYTNAVGNVFEMWELAKYEAQKEEKARENLLTTEWVNKIVGVDDLGISRDRYWGRDMCPMDEWQSSQPNN